MHLFLTKICVWKNMISVKLPIFKATDILREPYHLQIWSLQHISHLLRNRPETKPTTTNYNYNFNNRYNYNTATTTNKTITTTNANFETYSKDVHPPNLEASHTIHNELLSSLNTQWALTSKLTCIKVSRLEIYMFLPKGALHEEL